MGGKIWHFHIDQTNSLNSLFLITKGGGRGGGGGSDNTVIDPIQYSLLLVEGDDGWQLWAWVVENNIKYF